MMPGNASRDWAFSTFFAIVAFAVAESPALGGQLGPREPTFTKDVAPILQRSCENCHRANGVGPMPLTTYEEVRPWAAAIKRKIASREMPPWFIEKNVGIQKFKDDPSLSDLEIATIEKWADSGAPRGNLADMPAPRRYPDGVGWTIGTPDLIVSSPVMTVKATGPDWHGEVGPVPTGLAEDRYVQAVEIKEVRLDGAANQRLGGKAGDLSLFVIHHSGVHEIDPADGTVRTSGDGFGGGYYIVYELGQNATIYPRDTGVLLKGGSSFTYTMHLHSIGKELGVRVDAAFKFHPKGWRPKYMQAGFTNMGLLRDELAIPANTDNVRFENYYRMPKPGIMTSFEPHMHSSGKRMCVEAIYPSGQREMLNCAGYNHNWVKVYMYEDDVAPLLPAGTVVHVIGWYNNSASNPRVVDPRNWKGWGQRSIDDMFHFQPRVTFLTEEQFREVTEAREKKKAQRTNTQNND